MATIVLSAAGMALGGSIGGSVLGMSMATIGRAAGATLGRVIDQRILGTGSEPIESGRIDRLRLTSASAVPPPTRLILVRRGMTITLAIRRWNSNIRLARTHGNSGWMESKFLPNTLRKLILVVEILTKSGDRLFR